MSKRADHFDRFTTEVEQAFGWGSDEFKRACVVERYWLDQPEPYKAPDKQAIMTELVGYENEIKRRKGEQPWDWRDKK